MGGTLQDYSGNNLKNAACLLDANGIAKKYGAVRALTDARLQVAPGQIVALMGANGAGKSTLIKILTGAVRHDSGEIHLLGQSVNFSSPSGAQAAGIVPVYQEPSLIPDLDLDGNLRLTNTPRDAFDHWVDALGLAIPDRRLACGQFPLANLRVLDLARALASEPKVLMLDEMTAALPTDMVAKVLKVVRGQADAGRGVIYISHRFSEIAELCDSATVLRDGKTVGDLKVEPGVEDKIVELMLGARLSLGQRHGDAPTAPVGPARLRIRELSVGSRLKQVSFDLHKGEVLGVVALEGQGQDQLFDALAGFVRPAGGSISLNGQPQRFGHPGDAIAAGIKLVPGDRSSALLAQRSVHENIALPFSASPRSWGPLKRGHERERATFAIERLQIDTRAQSEVQRLSGGNQQKVTIARWIATGVETLLLFDPTRGIDVRTKRQIYPLVRELAQHGASVLLYTSELAEIPLACDRVVAIFNGEVVDVIDAADADEETLMRLCYGLKADAEDTTTKVSA